MEFVDAHIHLSDEEYAECVNEIIAEAKKANVVALVSNSMDLETSKKSLELAEKYSGMVYAALGIHPWNAEILTENELHQTLDLISQQRNNGALVAIGEVGLDGKLTKTWGKQLKVFDEMLHLAEKLGLPVIVHSRLATAQVIELLPSYNIKKVLLHWFSNPISALAKVVENGYYITEGPPAVFSNGIREVVRRIPLTNLLTETDGPVRFTNPPFNGKRTTPAFIPAVVEAVAEIKNMDAESVAMQILRNFKEFFGERLKLRLS